MKAKVIEYDLIRELFDYKDGNLLWKVNKGKRALVGAVAGTLHRTGYINVSINKKVYLAHRIIWTWHFGVIPSGLQIDHIDGNRSNNLIENLRLVTHQENQCNRTKAKGYYWYKMRNKWAAQITQKYKKIHLGYFDTEQEARAAYLDAKKELHTITEK